MKKFRLSILVLLVSAVCFAQTNTVKDQDVSVSKVSGDGKSNTATISLNSSETDTYYLLREDVSNSLVQAPVLGSGKAFNFGNISFSKNRAYNVLAAKEVTSGAMEFKPSNRNYLDGGVLSHTSNSFTVELWGRVRSSNRWTHMIENGGEEYGMQCAYRLEVGNQGELYLAIADGTKIIDLSKDTGWQYDTWYHWAFSYDGSVLRLYQDGVEVGSRIISLDVTNRDGTLLLGSHRKTERFFDGDLDDVRIWNYVRTADEIANHRFLQLIGNETGLMVYYNFEAGSGNTVQNRASSSGANNAQLMGNPKPSWINGQTLGSSTDQLQMSSKVKLLLIVAAQVE